MLRRFPRVRGAAKLERFVVIRLWFPQTKDYLGYALRPLKLRGVQREGDIHVFVGLSHNFERKARATKLGQA
jgi:hypothetical protein